jgi:hypothetical protein
MGFPESAFVPLAVGFFGLATGYLIYGREELFSSRRRAGAPFFKQSVGQAERRLERAPGAEW